VCGIKISQMVEKEEINSSLLSSPFYSLPRYQLKALIIREFYQLFVTNNIRYEQSAEIKSLALNLNKM